MLFLRLLKIFKLTIDNLKNSCIIFSTGRKNWVFLEKGDKKVDGLEGADFYRSALQELIFETQDLGILDLIYKILIQAKN